MSKVSQVISLLLKEVTKLSQFTMLLRIAKIVLALVLSFTFTFSLWKIIICFHEKYFDNEVEAVERFLDDNQLGQYKLLFRELGK